MVMVFVTVNVIVFHLFGCGRAQPNYFDGEVQLFASQGMVEIQPDGVLVYLADVSLHGMPFLIFHLQHGTQFQRNMRWEFAARYVHEGFWIPQTVGICRLNADGFGAADGQAVQLMFQAGDDVPVALDEFDRLRSFGCINDLIFNGQGVIERDNHVVNNGQWGIRLVQDNLLLFFAKYDRDVIAERREGRSVFQVSIGGVVIADGNAAAGQ